MDRRKRNKKKQNSIENFLIFFARELLRGALFFLKKYFYFLKQNTNHFLFYCVILHLLKQRNANLMLFIFKKNKKNITIKERSVTDVRCCKTWSRYGCR